MRYTNLQLKWLFGLFAANAIINIAAWNAPASLNAVVCMYLILVIRFVQLKTQER